MKGITGKIVTLIAAMGITASAVGAPSASESMSEYQLTLRPESRVWLTGDSTLHPYGSTATVVTLNSGFKSMDARPWTTVAERLSRSKVVAFVVTIPVEELKSGEKKLDKNLYKAMKAAEFPAIQFRLTDDRLMENAAADGTTTLTAHGVLSIAGVENEISIDFLAESKSEGVHLLGTKPLLMTDYGIKPPTMLGMIKTRNEVVVHFDLYLSEAAQPQKTIR